MRNENKSDNLICFPLCCQSCFPLFPSSLPFIVCTVARWYPLVCSVRNLDIPHFLHDLCLSPLLVSFVLFHHPFCYTRTHISSFTVAHVMFRIRTLLPSRFLPCLAIVVIDNALRSNRSDVSITCVAASFFSLYFCFCFNFVYTVCGRNAHPLIQRKVSDPCQVNVRSFVHAFSCQNTRNWSHYKSQLQGISRIGACKFWNSSDENGHRVKKLCIASPQCGSELPQCGSEMWSTHHCFALLKINSKNWHLSRQKSTAILHPRGKVKYLSRCKETTFFIQ